MKVVFYDEDNLAKRLNVERRHFHRKIKPIILSDFPAILKELDVKNPDIGLDKYGIIYLADTNHEKISCTNFNISDYID